MNRKNIEAIYSLSPSQRGMLFETVAGAQSGVFIEQLVIRMTGEVDLHSFQRAWELVLKRHSILRTAFVWKDQEDPFQIVLREVGFELSGEDWREFPAADQQSKLQLYLSADRQRGFDLSSPPLMRVALFRIDESSYRSVWTGHHILMDGWCVSLIIRDFIACYESLTRGQVLEAPVPRPYKDYILWLKQQDLPSAEAFWRAKLQGLSRPTPLSTSIEQVAASASSGYQEKKRLLSRETTDQVRLLMRQRRLPVSILFQGIWALLLSRYSGDRTVVFGVTVSGRPPELAGVESMIGLFINTIPVVIAVPREMLFWAWLNEIQEAQMERQPFEYCSAGQIHQWSEIPGSKPLFESILVFENYPFDGSALTSASLDLDLQNLRSAGAQTKYPLTILLEPGRELSIQIVYDSSRLDASGADCLLDDLLALIEILGLTQDVPLGLLLEQMAHRPIPTVKEPQRAAEAPASRPHTTTETAVLEVWTRILGAERIGLQDNFFELGGHSLLATQVISRLRETFSLELPLRALFEHPTIEGLSRHLETLQGKTGEADETPKPEAPGVADFQIPHASRETELPISFAQERLWLLDQLESTSAYNVQGALQITGTLNVAALQAGLNEIVNRHEILRTCFRSIDGRPCQVVMPPSPLPVEQVEVPARNPIEQLTEIQRWAAQDLLHPFDLTKGPLLRIRLLKMAEQDQVLILTAHHIVTDGWSNHIFFHELTALYQTYSSGRASALEKPGIQYADFAVWQRRWLQGPRLEELLAYWKKKLAGAPPTLSLTTDRPRPALQTFNGEMQAIDLTPELTRSLKALCHREGATLFMTLLAAFKLLLYRYTGQDDIVLGTPIANRNHRGIEDLIGFFVNTLALRTDLSGNPTFQELLGRIKETALEAYTHQDLPFERLVEELQPERDLSHNPVFQILFNMLNVRQSLPELPELKVRPFPLPELVTRFDLTLYSLEENEQIRFELVSNTGLFDRETGTRLLEHLRRLLEQLAENPRQSIDSYGLSGPEEQALLPNPAEPLPIRPEGNDLPIHQGISLQAKKTPQRTAVVDAAGTWSYEELETISNRIAHFLVQRGIKSGDVVAVYASASAGFICSLLGALKAGATFFVLDPEYPARRLLRSLRKAQPSALLYLQAAGELPPELTEFFAGACLNCRLDLPAGRAELIRSFLSLYSTTDPNMQVGPDDPAYLAFTSGSTGEPLGILGTHRPVSHFLQWHIRTFQLNEQDRFSLLSGLSHDPLLRDSFTALWMGASVHIPPAGEKEIEGGLARWMQREAITVAHLSPSMAEMLCRDGVELPALRRAFFHGDRLTYGDLQRLHRSAAGCRFVNYYGATETPQANGHYPVEMEALERHQAGEPVPLGSGIEGVQLLILNRAGQPAGIGEPGEICIRTPYLSRGYLDEERLTQQRFQTNPFTGSPEDRMYRTGDLGRYRPDGTVEFLARRDHQIKLRGFRIEPREIEAALEEQPAVRQAVIIPVESGGELQLVACLLLNPQDAQDPSFSGDQCRRFLAERIPAYMVPSGIVTFEALPLTPNGKIDRQALAAAAQSAAVKREFVPPGDQTETALARIWQEVLGVEQVGATDNFFALGGHSLKATQVASRIHREFGVRPPLRDLFRFPTIRELAPQLHVNQPQPHRRIEPAPAAEDYPASHAQRRLWALCQIDDAFAAYNMPRALLFDGELDRAAFEQALIELGRRHESLRTTFKVVGGRLRQQVHPEPGFRVQDVDLTRESDPMHRAEELADEDAARPFELETGPLLRASILQISSNRYLLLFNLHHIIADAWSLNVLIREFAQLYRARRGAPNSGSLRLPPLSIQYKDYACWQNALLEGEEAVRHLEYWRQRLSGERPALELPADRTRPPVKTYHGRRLHFVFEAGETRALNDFSRERQASLYMTLVAAVKALLYRYTDQQEILTGCPVAGRNHVDLENQIGFYVNMLPLRDRVAGDQGFAELLQQVKQTAAEAYEHQDYPFDRLVEELNIPRDVSRSPLFEVVVVLQNAEASELQMEGVNIAPFDRETRTSKFDLNFTFEQQNDRLRGFIEFNSDLFFEDRVERMAQHLRTLIGSALSEPGRAVDRLNLLPEAEQERVLVEFNSTAASYPETATIVDLFEEQVEITPDAFAVRFDDRRLTYRQLNSRANALARRLREEFHVAPNDLIGVVLDRSERMITTLLAVLKAGGAYIPIDPAYPVERIRFIIEDSGCQLVLTENNRYLESLRLAAFGRKYTLLDIDTIHHEEETNLQPGASPEHAAYVIYTSGSTGQPKGCIITHRNVVRLMKNALFRFDFGPQDVWVSAHSFSFDFSVWEMYGALLYGGQVVVARREEARDAAAFRDLIHRCGVTVLNQTPAAFYNLIEVERSQPSHDLGRHLRYVIFGGDRLEPAHLRPWAERYPLEEIRLVNMYGITETTVHVSYGPITREHVFSGEKCSPIGVPLPETRVYICDEKMNPQPIGVPGELYIGGSGVCRGYLNRPELSAARFLPSPFRKDERLYRTGDLGRWRSDGTLEYIGRNDSQVQIRGFRVELGEIQSVLTAHALVRDAAVIVSQLAGGAAGDASGADQRLVAYLIPKSPGQLPVTELRAYAKEKLPDYMVPSHFVQLDSFPLTANGKIDYRALPAPEGTREELGGDYVAPGDETERQIAEIWRQTLGVERVGLNDNFFDIGGHSLLLIQVHRRLREACHAELPLVELFRYPTVRTLAEYLNSITTRRREQPPFEQPAPADQPAPPEEPAMEAPAPFDQPSPVQVANTGRLSPPVLDQEAPDQPAPEPFGPDRQEEEEEAEPEYSLPVMVINTMPLSLPQSAQSAPDHIASVQSAPAQPAPEREGREEIAIVGMAGRFPGAPDLAAFWRNLCRGIESVVSLSDKELRAAGVPEELIANPRYVKTKPVLDGVADFDAEFFGISPREAEVMDPQHRLFLECAWEALENAGYDSATYSGRIGVYAGASLNSYLLNNLYPNRHLLESLGVYPVLIGNDRDFIATRVSYKLNLKGPSINLSTACSTSLVAVQQACLSLLSRQSDMVLAGGVSIKVPQHEGYLYDEGGILSPDGHCRAFDAHARGTVGGSGVGIVVLKRLTDALQDGDSILAVIKGAALGNDGSDKIGYAAPSVKGQAAVIAEAYAQAGVRQETISYVEAHGTGTSLGDPIEIAALTEAFGSPERGFCAIGSVKTNIGHLDAAAGIAGLIKTVLALQHQQIPPSLNYEHPNPGINFSDSPFYVNTKLSPWRAPDAPRRAGVSSFGLGGTNVHLVLEEFTAPPSSGPSRPFQILTLSGRTPSALETATRRLAEHFDQQPEIDLADAAFTLGVGRRDFEHRRVAICRGAAEAASLLRENDPRRILSGVSAKNERRVAFLFPGGGAQYADMAVGLYLDEPVFREQIDLCAELLRPHLNIDLRRIMYTSQQNQPEQAADNLLKPSLGLPALFATEYALAQLWMAWGIRPQVMIGHSLGEYAAACLAGVISLEDALALVALRGRLFEELPEGRMLSIPLSEHELRPYLDRQFSIAAINHPNACVVSGAAAAIEQLEAALAETQIESRRLHISVAAHSTLVEPILDRFRDFISRIELRPPQIPFLSNLTGSWITPKEATDPEYWVKHLRLTVRFASGAQELFRNAELMLLEVGPGNTLASLVQQHPAKSARQEVCCSVRHPNDSQPDSAFLLATLGRLWVAGVKIDWRQFYAGQQRRRTTLPATPFDRKRYWIEADPAAHLLQPATTAAPSKRPDLAEWFYAPSWRRKPVHALPLAPTGSRLFFMDETGFGESLARQLRTGQQFLITVRPGRDFERVGEDAYSLDPADPDHYQELLRRLKSAGHLPQQIVHAWSLQPTAPGKTPDDDPQPVDQMEQRGFYSLLYLAQAWKRLGSAPVRITMLTNYTQDVTGEEPLQPEKATVLGPIKAISQECPEIACRAIDLEFPNAASSDAPETSLIKALEAEISASETEMFVAYRGSGNYRWVLNYEPMRLPVLPDRLREHGVYLITGGTGGVGRLLAQYLAGAVQARLALLGRHARSVDPEVIHEIEKVGGEVLLLDADVANQQQMQAAIDQTLARFGMIHGVIHAAGITTGNSLFRPFEEMDAEACEAQFRPKIYGLRVLEKMLAWQKLDFVLLISSNASVLGGLGLVAYSAANHVLDLFATRQSRRGSTPWISANWDGWPTERRQRIDGTHTSIDKYAMTPEECREAFRRIASLCRGQVVVSSGDLAARLQRWTQLQSEPEAESPAPPLKGGPPAPEAVPRDEVEQRLAELWREMLGVEQVGRYDNFFELRGDSLLGTRLITRLNRLFGVELPLRSLFEDPTIAGLAERVEASRRHVPESLKRPADPVGAEEEEVRI